MANHVRRQLREAVATALTGLATTGTRVFQSRVYELQETEMPGLVVYTTGEETVDQSISNLIGRSIQIVIEAKTKAAADLDDKLDQMAKEIEIALGGTVSVAGQPIALQYEGADIEMIEADRPAGMITMRYSALLYTQRATPDVIG